MSDMNLRRKLKTPVGKRGFRKNHWRSVDRDIADTITGATTWKLCEGIAVCACVMACDGA
jgi:hypothetical protein